MSKKILSVALALLMCLSTVAVFASCGGGKGGRPDALVIMTEERADRSADEVVVFRLSGF